MPLLKSLIPISLNDCLETGINFTETIPSILARFRLKEIGVISDIRSFLQTREDRKCMRFLWYDDDYGSIKFFQHTRGILGLQVAHIC